MRKSRYTLLFASFIFSIMTISNTVSATKWVELKPQEVVDRAEFIVVGKYDFTSKGKPSEFVFQGFDFNIISVYKGDITKQFTAGIDYNDVGWAEEFQKEGGEFLLFLEKSKDAEFLIPVGGPNGMVQVNDGKVEEPNDNRRTFFEDFLKSHPEKTIDLVFKTQNDDPNEKTYLPLYVSAIVLIGITVLFLLYCNKRKR